MAVICAILELNGSSVQKRQAKDVGPFRGKPPQQISCSAGVVDVSREWPPH
jgi:hypothetical protein